MPLRNLLNQYLIPGRRDKEMTVLTDAGKHGAVLLTPKDSVILSGAAIRILHSSFFDGRRKRLGQILGARKDKTDAALAWIKDSADDSILKSSATPPKRGRITERRVRAGVTAHWKYWQSTLAWYENDRSMRPPCIGTKQMCHYEILIKSTI